MGAAYTKAANKQIGEGTFGTVCVVTDEQQNNVAIKHLKRNSSAEEVGLFNREIIILKSINHGSAIHLALLRPLPARCFVANAE